MSTVHEVSHGESLSDHHDRVVGELDALIARLRAVTALRAAKGKGLSETNSARASELMERIWTLNELADGGTLIPVRSEGGRK